jgi:hypothetical protein
MKKILTFLIGGFLVPIGVCSQITITRNDMPNVGDTLIYTSTLVPVGINYVESGPDFSWDFSDLMGGTQGEDIYAAVSSTPFLYQLVFNVPPWNPPASIASPEEDFNLIPGVAFTDYYDFYKEQNASYTAVGFGVTINDIPVPVKYNQPEMLYKFPLNYGNQPDSSESFFSINVPDFGYYETYRKRVNVVDGWGTLTTPFGAFATLRIKSLLTTRDSIYIDSLQTGIPIDRNITEYKWMGSGFGIPLLKVSKEGLLPAQAEFLSEQQEPLTVDAGPDVTILQGGQVQLEATVSGGSPPYGFVWSNGALGNPINVTPESTTTYTVNVIDAGFNFASDNVTVNVIPANVHQIELPQGWSSLSSFLAPLVNDLETLMQPVDNEMIILQNLEGIYYPAGGINTLINWDHSGGYMIKLSAPASFSVTGHPIENTAIELQAGWNLLPVISACELETTTIHNQLENKLEIIKDIAGINVFWPEKSVATLTTLFSGKAYFIKVNDNCTVEFPECR